MKAPSDRHPAGTPPAPAADHPDDFTLVAWSDGQLVAEAEGSTRRHVEACAQCTARLKELDQLGDLEPVANAELPSDQHLEHSLGELRERLLLDQLFDATAESKSPPSLFPPNTVSSRQARRAPRRATPWRPWIERLAALLVISVLSTWAFSEHRSSAHLSEHLATVDREFTAARERITRQRQEIERLRRPVANVRRLRIDDSGPLRAEDGGAFDPQQATLVTWIPRKILPQDRSYSAKLQAPGQAPLEIGALHPFADGLVFYLPPGALTAKEYTLTVWDDRGNSWSQELTLPFSRD